MVENVGSVRCCDALLKFVKMIVSYLKTFEIFATRPKNLIRESVFVSVIYEVSEMKHLLFIAFLGILIMFAGCKGLGEALPVAEQPVEQPPAEVPAAPEAPVEAPAQPPVEEAPAPAPVVEEKPATNVTVAETAAQGKVHEILVSDGTFSPDRLTIKVGDTVVWKNVRTGSVGTSYMYIYGSLGPCRRPVLESEYPPGIPPGGQFNYTFTKPQLCTFVDGIRTTQFGKINVTE